MFLPGNDIDFIGLSNVTDIHWLSFVSGFCFRRIVGSCLLRLIKPCIAAQWLSLEGCMWCLKCLFNKLGYWTPLLAPWQVGLQYKVLPHSCWSLEWFWSRNWDYFFYHDWAEIVSPSYNSMLNEAWLYFMLQAI